MGIQFEQLLTARILLWRHEADTLHERGADEAAEVIEACADELEGDLAEGRGQMVSEAGQGVEA